MRLGGAIVCAIVLALAPLQALAWTVDDTFQALYDAHVNTGVPYARLYRIVGCETGQTFNPHVVGDHGNSWGPVQFNKYGGELPRFYARGYTDVYNPYEAIDYLANAIMEGRASAWTCR